MHEVAARKLAADHDQSAEILKSEKSEPSSSLCADADGVSNFVDHHF